MNPAVMAPFLLAGSALMPSVAAHAATSAATSAAAVGSHTATVAFGAEAWYSSPELCLTSSICLPIASPATATYPAGTLHIAEAAGNESARTYLSLRRPLSRGQIVRSGVLRLPLDIDPADGSVAPDLAKIKACTTTVRIKAVDGVTTKPPAVDCANAPVSRVIGIPATELDINLGPIARRLSTPGTSLALLPVLSVGATWDVTLSSDLRAKHSASTPVLILTSVARSAARSKPKPTKTTTPKPHVTPSTGGGDVGIGPSVVVPPEPLDSGPQTSQGSAGGDSQPQIAPTTARSAIRLAASAHGFDYPVVFLVPLLILAGLMGFGRQLTRPLTTADDRSIEP